MICETENGSLLTFAGTQNSNMSDGGAKEQQQGGFYCFCQTPQTPSNPHSNPTSNPIKPNTEPLQTHIQTQHQTIIYYNEDEKNYVERYNPSV